LIALRITGIPSGASTFSGTGSEVSVPLDLGGDINVAWEARPASSPECDHYAEIHLADRSATRDIVVTEHITVPSAGSRLVAALPRDRYVIDVRSTCDWSFRLDPR
jgi:hypothetical protein